MVKRTKKTKSPKQEEDKSVEKEKNVENENDFKSESVELSLSDRLSIMDTCLAYATYEANVYWQRNAIYLTLNSIMFGALLAFSKDINNLLIFAIGAFGVFINWYWVHVNKYSKYLAERWREDARNIARQDKNLEDAFKSLLGKSDLVKPSGRKPSDVMNLMSNSFRLLWILITIYGVYLIIPEIYSWLSVFLRNQGTP